MCELGAACRLGAAGECGRTKVKGCACRENLEELRVQGYFLSLLRYGTVS